MLSTIKTIVANIETLTKQHDATLCWHDEMHCQFDDSFNYDELVALNISKQNLTRLFANPKIHNEVDPKKHKFSIKLCTNEVIKTHFFNFWWMTFDIPPHNYL